MCLHLFSLKCEIFRIFFASFLCKVYLWNLLGCLVSIVLNTVGVGEKRKHSHLNVMMMLSI